MSRTIGDSDGSLMGRTLPRWLLSAAVVVLGVVWLHALLAFGGPGVDSLFARWVYDVVVILAGVICVLRMGSERAWGLLGLGLLAFAAGSLIYSMAGNLDAVPIPSISDPLWLALYPCAYGAILMLVRSQSRSRLTATRLDGLISGLTCAAVLACVSVPAAVANSAGAGFWEQATNLAYPIADLILFGALVSSVALRGWRLDRSAVVLGIAILAWESADLLYLFNATGVAGNVADALGLTGALGMAAAATIYRRQLPREHLESGLYTPVGFAIVALLILLVGTVLGVTPVALGLAAAALALVLARMGLALAQNRVLLSESRVEALTDPLTGLGNRRQLKLDLDQLLAADGPRHLHVLALFDLNGFKGYNDSFGHGAGDALLAQLGHALSEAVRGHGKAYRMGGDEFCVLAPQPEGGGEQQSDRWAAALASRGDGFLVDAAYGIALLPSEASDTSTALALADARMYGNKAMRGRPGAARQLAGVLIAVLEERAPAVARSGREVGTIAWALAERLALSGPDLDALRHAASLHDLGKMAIPDSIFEKPGALSPSEWAMIRQHPVIGERILAAAPALEQSAQLVRWSHERIDGGGYPDGLTRDQIPLGARIIHVADAFVAITSDRRYRGALPVPQALAELRRCADSDFDPVVVAALHDVIENRELDRDAESATTPAGVPRLRTAPLVRMSAPGEQS